MFRFGFSLCVCFNGCIDSLVLINITMIGQIYTKTILELIIVTFAGTINANVKLIDDNVRPQGAIM